jgi:rod shape determining protein RodA
MPRYRSFRDLDWPLLLITLVICGLGVLEIYSATLGTKFQDAWWKQIVWVALGIALMWLMASIDYHTLLGQVPLYYGVTVAGLLVTVTLAKKVFGAKRWLTIWGFNLQVSEFAKIVIVLMVARYLSELKRDEVEIRDLFKIGVLVGIPTVLVIKQPDLGTSLTYVAILVAGILLAGIRWQHLAAIALLGGLSIPAAWPFLNEYQRGRLETFVNPYADPQGRGYQVIQSRIAVGHGGMWGTGATHGTQTQLGFLPVPHTDFIFSAFAEEHGFVGVFVVLGLYFLLIMQVVQNAQAAPDRAGMYICMGVAALLLFHLFVNAGMVSGNMPVTGIPLPLMSSGGSHMFSVFMMLGLVNNVRLRRFAS